MRNKKLYVLDVKVLNIIFFIIVMDNNHSAYGTQSSLTSRKVYMWCILIYLDCRIAKCGISLFNVTQTVH